jgi:hypothetical protein
LSGRLKSENDELVPNCCSLILKRSRRVGGEIEFLSCETKLEAKDSRGDDNEGASVGEPIVPSAKKMPAEAGLSGEGGGRTENGSRDILNPDE